MPPRITFSTIGLFRKSSRIAAAAATAAAAAAVVITSAGVTGAAASTPAFTGAAATVTAATTASNHPPLRDRRHAGLASSGAAARAHHRAARWPGAKPRRSVTHRRHDAGRHEHACHSSRLHRWICQAETIMVKHGTPKRAVNPGAAFIVVLHESGGNPRARNNWDSNAAAGTPSEGIAQVTRPTFDAYALPGRGDIWNPVDNMIAAFRYAVARYGSMNDIPGVVSVRRGGVYAGF